MCCGSIDVERLIDEDHSARLIWHLIGRLVEAAQIAVRFDEGMLKQYLHRCHQKPKGVAKVAAARKLAVRLYWMLRTQTGYPEIVRFESSPRVPLVGAS
ncbi:MAG TPA: hypothetical protein VFE61_01850 [Candidatus Sulfotelmatobacter sp.]|nr:hypothetical protein [Candidatus Sulfotelmatobacter sp.]